MIDRTCHQAGNTQRTAVLKYEFFSDRLVRPNTRKLQNKHMAQINLQSDYTELIVNGVEKFCANMIKKSLRSRELECFLLLL